MSLFGNTTETFLLAKRMDGQPTRNGSPLIMGLRTGYFLFRPFTKQEYYESIGDVDELVRQIKFSVQLQQIGFPRWMADSYLLVFEVFKSAHHASGGVLTMPNAGEASLGLHCVLWTGYLNNGSELTFLNSWGKGWGEQGFGSVSRDYLLRYFHEAFVIRRAKWGPTPSKFHLVAPHSMTEQEFRQRLMVTNPRFVVRERRGSGETWRYELFEASSPSTEEPVECLNIQNGFGMGMGWAFVRHRQAVPWITEILELFVWPTFRRMGVGSALEELSRGRAQLWQSSELHLMLHEADSVIGPLRGAARGFALARGYQWRWHNRVAPRRTGTAVKIVQTSQ